MDAVNRTWSSAGAMVLLVVGLLLVVGPSLQPVLLLVIQSIVLFSLLFSFSGEIIYVDVILLILPDFRIQRLACIWILSNLYQGIWHLS